MPSFLHDRVQTLLNGILQKSPDDRFTIQQIRDSEFCKFNGLVEI